MVWSTQGLDIFTDNWAGVLGKSQSILSFISVKNQPNQNVFFVRLQHNMRHNHCWHSHTSLKKVKCSGEILKLEIKTSLNLIYKLRNFLNNVGSLMHKFLMKQMLIEVNKKWQRVNQKVYLKYD